MFIVDILLGLFLLMVIPEPDQKEKRKAGVIHPILIDDITEEACEDDCDELDTDVGYG